MAITEVYVDPSIAADSGTGTSGDPYGDLEYAIEQTTFDTTNGTRMNIKAGTDEVVAAELGAAMASTFPNPAWAPSESAPAVFQGYTTTAGDGGIGGISGGGSVAVFFTLIDSIHLVDLHIHNTGSAIVCQVDNFCSITNCEFDNSTGSGVHTGVACTISGCYFHNLDGSFMLSIDGGFAYSNWFDVAGATPLSAISCQTNRGCVVENNIMVLDGAADGVRINTDWCTVDHNSIYSAGAATGQGIVAGATNIHVASIANNLVEGFSGTGGVGIDLTASGVQISRYGGNAVQDCTTDYGAVSGITLMDLGDNESLSASPFTNAATDDFSPVDTGNVKEGALPTTIGGGLHSGTATPRAWKGAIQPAAAGGGAPGHGNMQGGMQ
jgi:hypothetical protein